jgi:DNA-binding winged helix-turn-helix (wHTH) protein
MSTHFWPAGEPTAVFRFGEFTFDCESRLLLCNGTERHLSPKAQQLLRLLILARPRALSRQELYDELWPSTFVCETNLASIVNEVRRALGAGASQYIRTVHGFGYAFQGEAASSAPVRVAAAMLKCEGYRHPLFIGDNVVGRAADATVLVADGTTSRCHALITVDGDELSITDLDSKNGTYVNGERIGRAPVTVRPGARIEFGAVVASIVSNRISTTDSLRLRMPGPRRANR